MWTPRAGRASSSGVTASMAGKGRAASGAGRRSGASSWPAAAAISAGNASPPRSMPSRRMHAGENRKQNSRGSRSTGGGAVSVFGGAHQLRRGRKDELAPDAPLAALQPQHAVAQAIERRLCKQLAEQVVDAMLELQVLRAEAVGRYAIGQRWHGHQQ